MYKLIFQNGNFDYIDKRDELEHITMFAKVPIEGLEQIHLERHEVHSGKMRYESPILSWIFDRLLAKCEPKL